MRPGLALACLSTLAVLLGGCGMDAVSGKTTTTGNGGGLVALGPDGSPAAGCLVLAARSWDSVGGVPGAVDTLRGDRTGFVRLPAESYAFVEVRDSAHALGAWAKRLLVPEGSRQTVALDSLRTIEGRWADRGGIASGRLFLDSSFLSVPLQDPTGTFTFVKVPVGEYAMVLDAEGSARRSMGTVRVGPTDVRYVGSGNVVVVGDTTGSPLWIDDFESGSIFPLLHRSVPNVSPWYVWASQATLSLPGSNQWDSLLRAIGPDSTRSGRAFHARFSSLSPYSWVALGFVGMELDLSARQQLCFSYRSDTLVKIQFQRDSVDTVRPALSSAVSSSPQWKDVCVPTGGFVPNSDMPDSLSSWSAFGKRVLVLEFQVPSGGTFLDLDDIRLR